jgi:hypothetical protein
VSAETPSARDLERQFGPGSQPEHLDEEGCWCRHPRNRHQWDPVRDYRELMCDACDDAEEVRSKQT